MQTCTREIVIFLLAAGRGWYGCQRRLSPLPGSVSCHAIVTDDQGAVSWSMDTGVGGLTSGLRVLSALSIAGGSLEVTRSQVVFHFHSFPLVLPAVPQRSRAPLPPAVSRACAR